MPTAYLVDLDGTLIDSAAAQDRAWRWWAARHGVDPDRVAAVHGRTAADKVRLFAPYANVAAEAELMAQVELDHATEARAVPGAARLLASGVPLAIVTSGTHQLVVARLGAAGLPVPDILVTAESTARGKPAPDPYVLAAQRLDVSVRDCTVLEDSPAGIVAGSRAGAFVVALATTFPAETLILAGADRVFRSLEAFLRRSIAA